jgi:hypothetical protein
LSTGGTVSETLSWVELTNVTEFTVTEGEPWKMTVAPLRNCEPVIVWVPVVPRARLLGDIDVTCGSTVCTM